MGWDGFSSFIHGQDYPRLRKHIKFLEQEHRSEIIRREHSHARRLHQVNDKHAQEVFRIQDVHANKVGELKEFLADKDRDIKELKTIHTHEINQRNARIKATEKDRDDRITKLQQNHAVHIANLEKDSADEAARYENHISATIQEHETKLAGMEQAHQNEVSTLLAQHDAATNSLLKQHETTVEGLLAEVKGLENVLRKRDNNSFLASMLSDADTKQDPDEHIRDKFLEIEKMVEDLSILTWKPDQRIWTDQRLRLLGGNQNPRLLKKRILQDYIWTLLHKYIFCSPFRIFGKEGEVLEKEWNDHFGKDPQFDNGRFIWPPLGIETERWRYVTIRECRKALMEKLPSKFDPRAKIKEGFVDTKTKLSAELKSMLDGMVQYTEADAKSAEGLVMMFANAWLEFMMHRCRFILSVGSPGFLSASEKARRGEEGNLELTIVPGLRRYGDLRGIELAGSTVIGDFEGDFFRLS